MCSQWSKLVKSSLNCNIGLLDDWIKTDGNCTVITSSFYDWLNYKVFM